MKVLLVEPNYKNSYPPMGLMKIASYHNSRNDTVYFAKGTDEIEETYGRIYITTLFTFYFDLTIRTIEYYNQKYNCDIFVGGIAASIMTENFRDKIDPRIHLLTGMLTDSSQIGYDDHINIDLLDMDYNILNQIDYEYKTEDGYISYTSRGCVNKCPFCAVPKLEPIFCMTNNLKEQIEQSKKKYGPKKDLLLLDNNILAFNIDQLKDIVTLINNLGFTKENKFFGELEIEKVMRKIKYLETFTVFEEKINILHKKLISIIEIKLKNKNLLNDYPFKSDDENEKYEWIINNFESILIEFKKLDRRRGKSRLVDFNQGMDARLLTEEKMKVLSTLPIKPFRLAFDHIAIKDKYEASIRLAAKYGVHTFSNYLLYNFDDNPNDLYERMQFNIELAHDLNVNIHSFPMKYAPIELTHRDTIGKKWNKYFLSNYRRILKPTKGVVGVGRSYFYNAFGNNSQEFEEILSMPYDLLTYRNFFKNNNIQQKWKNEFSQLSSLEKSELIAELSRGNYEYDHKIMKFYKIRYEIPNTWKKFL